MYQDIVRTLRTAIVRGITGSDMAKVSGRTARCRAAHLGFGAHEERLPRAAGVLEHGADGLAVILGQKHVLVAALSAVDELDAFLGGALEVPPRQV